MKSNRDPIHDLLRIEILLKIHILKFNALSIQTIIRIILVKCDNTFSTDSDAGYIYYIHKYKAHWKFEKPGDKAKILNYVKQYETKYTIAFCDM
jgi:hypothetical protein